MLFFLSQYIKELVLLAVLLAVTDGFGKPQGLSEEPWPTDHGKIVRGLTCTKVLDEEEDFSDLAQAGARTATGSRSSVVGFS